MSRSRSRREQNQPGVRCDMGAGDISAILDLPATPERVFRTLASREITDWWVRPGVFDTREWTGDVRPGGGWRASGMARGQPYTAEGEFLEVAASHRLVHTWVGPASNGGATTLTYTLEPRGEGTRLTFRQTGFAAPAACENFAAGWETSFARLAEILAAEPAGAGARDVTAGPGADPAAARA